MFSRLSAVVLAATLSATFPVLAQGWTYTDGAGQTVTLDAVPQRIIASWRPVSVLRTTGAG